LIKLKNAVGLPPKIKASFDESYVQVEQNLLWYRSYHTTINQWTGAPMEPSATEADTTLSSSATTAPSSDTTAPSSDTTVTLPGTNGTVRDTTQTSLDTTMPSNDTTVSGMTEPMIPTPTYPQFDFDSPIPGVITKCPNKSGQSSCRSSLFFVIIVVIMSTTIMVV